MTDGGPSDSSGGWQPPPPPPPPAPGSSWSSLPPPPPPPGTIVFGGDPRADRPTAGDARTGPLPLHPMTLGDILDGAFKLYRANFAVVLAVTAAITVPLQVVGALLTSQSFSIDAFDPDTVTSEASMSWTDVGGGVVALISILVIPFVTGAISRVVSASYLGQRLAAKPALKATFRRLPSLLGAWILVHIVEGSVFIAAALLAIVLLVGDTNVPAAFILLLGGTVVGGAVALAAMALFQATAPAIVVEELGPIQGMRRSWRLMKPRFFPVLGIAVLSGIMASVVGNILGVIPMAAAVAMPGPLKWVPLALGGTLTTLVTTPFIAIVATLVYFDGRIRHEAFDLEVMAADLTRRAGGD